MKTKEIIISIVEDGRDCWRVTQNGNILGDSRGYSRENAIAEARRVVARTDAGEWQGNVWVRVLYVLCNRIR